MMNRPALVLATLPLFALGCQDLGNAKFQVRESVAQLQITHATPGEALEVIDAHGMQVQAGAADALGSLMFRHLDPGAGYEVRATVGDEHSRKLTVMALVGSLPAQDFYAKQRLVPGFQYITTRDGTTLSAFVALPPGDGPFPTVVNYSGYNPSQPGSPNQQFAFLCDTYPIICNPPSDPSGELAGLFGFATVSVNIRGTGCSGGAYDYFETMQLLDGYDVIETVAAQPWVLHNKVGMTGLSYPGIAQLFVASTRPPSLAAISPLSVIGNTATTIDPGGILNDGFAVEWVKDVLKGADPFGQGWEKGRVDGGDAVCGENQLLHGQKIDNVAQAETHQFYVPALFDSVNPTTFVDQINVPVFLAGAFEDEQTGPFFTTLLNRFTGSPLARFTVYNGVHPDGFAPQVAYEWKSFLDLFVAQRVPSIDKGIRSLAPVLFNQVFQSLIPLPPDRFTKFATYDDALASYKSEPPLRALFENGAGGTDPGAPVARFERSFSQWPPTETKADRYFFHADGTLSESMPAESDAAASFDLDPAAGERVVLQPGGNVFDLLPKYDYREQLAGKAIVFVSAPLAADKTFLGTSSADLWIKSNVDDADLQVSITEVRPDGHEMYVQSGWLRASKRGLGADSTEVWPSPTYLEADAAPLPAGQFTLVRVPIPALGHVFRATSRIRVSVETPGDVRALWRFQLKTFPGTATHTLALSATHPSSIALSLIPGMTAPVPIAACPSLRGQPCRPFVPFTNRPGM